MSKISNIIFNGKEHYITSSYGSRKSFSTAAGSTGSFHYGTDYGTNCKKLPQYAVENGSVVDCGRASDGALYVWVRYPRINKKMLHYHLDSLKVKNGQPVEKGTLLGYTGMTGKATGIHLHLGVKDLSTNAYEDPEKFAASYKEPAEEKKKYNTGTYQVNTALLNVRRGAGTVFAKLKFSQLTENAQFQVKKLNSGRPADGLVKGVVCTVTKVSGSWGKIPSGWISLDYCKRKSA